MKPSAILDKVNKLLALSESPNEFEASSALLKAQELLAKHNLSLADVQGQNTGEDIAMFGSMQSDYITEPWRLKLASVIADNFRCYAIGRRENTSIVFLGTETDVNVCQSIYAYTTKFIEGVCMFKGMTDTSFTKDYSTGFIEGLKAKFKEQMKHNKWELALSKPNKVVQAYEDIMNKAKVNNRSTQAFVKNSEAYERGYSDGKYYSPNTIETKDYSTSIYLEHEYKVAINELLCLTEHVPWMECFRMHPSYKLQKDLIEQLYENGQILLNKMENLELQMLQSDSTKEDVNQCKEVRYYCRQLIVAFYRAYHTPQSSLDVKNEYEMQYRDCIQYIQNYIEYTTQITE